MNNCHNRWSLTENKNRDFWKKKKKKKPLLFIMNYWTRSRIRVERSLKTLISVSIDRIMTSCECRFFWNGRRTEHARRAVYYYHYSCTRFVSVPSVHGRGTRSSGRVFATAAWRRRRRLGTAFGSGPGTAHVVTVVVPDRPWTDVDSDSGHGWCVRFMRSVRGRPKRVGDGRAPAPRGSD